MDLLEELAELTSSFESENIEYALCGGLAMAVYAFPRATLDIDLMIRADHLDRAKGVANALGFSLESGLMRFAGGKIQMYRLTKVHSESGDSLVLDMLLVTPDIEDVWESKRLLKWDRGEIAVVSPEGLIKLKSFRRSGQDQDDIKHLRRVIDES